MYERKLNDLDIRSALSIWAAFKSDRNGQIHELPVCNGKAIADMVILSRSLHCIEIKSDLDKVERALKQAEYYDRAFKRISIATTGHQLAKADRLLPCHWGVIIASQTKTGVRISVFRKAKDSPYFSMIDSLNLLWKSELQSIALLESLSSYKKANTKRQLVETLNAHLSDSKLHERISEVLKLRDRSRTAYR